MEYHTAASHDLSRLKQLCLKTLVFMKMTSSSPISSITIAKLFFRLAMISSQKDKSIIFPSAWCSSENKGNLCDNKKHSETKPGTDT